MLKLLKKISPSHEELFIEHYDRMLGWSLQLTEHDRDLAEDLLHDAFIHFAALTQPDLKTIRNLDGYLYMMLRNLHISQERRSSRARFQQLSIVEYESAATGLRTIDSRDVIRVQDELRRICHYACARKEKAKLASVLILRFFHGYYPSEIAQILRSPRAAIDKWLQLARAEAKLALSDAEVLRFKDEMPAIEFMPASFARSVEDLLSELRQTIFRTRQGDCFDLGQVGEIYQNKETPPLNCERLSHIVSCPQCLDEINHMLNLPPLSERYPTDSIGKDTSSKGGGRGGEGGGGVGGHEIAKKVRKYRRDAREAFEHHPSELCVSVNGYIQGSHKISSELSEFDLSANLADEVSFVEVFSEQGIRLLLLNAEERPPEGADTQTSRANLSDGRSVDLTLKYRSSWPTLHLVYRDPTFKAIEAIDVVALEKGSYATQAASSVEELSQQGRLGENLVRLASRLPKLRLNSLVIFRPATVTAVLALLAAAVFLLVNHHRGPAPALSAANLLQESAVAEEAIAARTDQVLHRTITLEERKSEPGATGLSQLIVRRKIEVWQSSERGITARRLYDERGSLIAGDWRRDDGVQTLYQHGTQPKLQLAPEKRGSSGGVTLSFDSVWQLSPSAKEFASLVGDAPVLHVEERATSYVIGYSSEPRSKKGGLLNATLVLSRADLRPIEQSLLIQQGNEVREFRFVETSFEQRPAGAVEPRVFEPDAELLVSTAAPSTGGNKSSLTPEPPPVPVPEPATRDLEVEVLRLLSEAKADLGEQVSLTRTAEGKLLVQGIVETSKRKAEILHALKPVTSNPSLRVEISSVSEALGRQKPSASNSTSVRQVEVPQGSTIPVDRDLREYFSSKGISNDRIDEEIRQYSNRVLSRSRQALRHAWALKRLAVRFTPEDLKALSAEARAKWLAMIREHAQGFQQETEQLRLELQPIFFRSGPSSGPKDEMEISNESDFNRALARLAEVASTNDEAMRSAFTISAGSGAFSIIKTPQFSRSVASAEKLAARIQAQAERTPDNQH